MARKNPVAAVYMLKNTKNDKVYIGETTNVSDRKSYYKNTAKRDVKYTSNPISQAIIKDGFDNFEFIIIVDSNEDPALWNDQYRTLLESANIAKYNSTDPEFGYNVLNSKHHTGRMLRNCGFKTKPSTKLKKSDPILVYDFDADDVWLYFGKKSFADDLGLDRATISHCAKRGGSVRHYLVYEVNPEKRAQYAKEVIHRKTHAKSINFLSQKSVKRYLKGLRKTNKFCKHWGLPEVDIDEIIGK